MKDNRDNKAIIIPVNDMRETLQDFTDEEVGGIIRALFNGGEPDFKDRAMRIVYRQLRAANERINATYEAKRERYKKAAEARWQKDGDGQQESTQEEAEIEPEEAENTDEKGENATHKTQSDAMQRNATHSDALKCNAIPNQTKPYHTKPNQKKRVIEKRPQPAAAHTLPIFRRESMMGKQGNREGLGKENSQATLRSRQTAHTGGSTGTTTPQTATSRTSA